MSKLVNLSEFFEDKQLFQTEDYQRGFSWNKKQLDDLWKDLHDLREGQKHYTGLICLTLATKQVYKGFKLYNIIDGQQRLITFVIFISVLVKIAEEANYSELDGVDIEIIKKKYLYEAEDIFRVSLSNIDDFDFFKETILEKGSSSSDNYSLYISNLISAKSFFENHIQKLIKNNNQKSCLDDLFNKITNSFVFVKLILDKTFDENLTFETMNNRGKPLSTLEILRNRLLSLVGYFNDDLDEREKVKQLISKHFASIYKFLGKNENKIDDDDEFLMYFYNVYYPYRRGKRDNYKVALLDKIFTRENVLNRNKSLNEIKDFVENMTSFSKLWYQSRNYREVTRINNFDEEEKEWLDKLTRLDVKQYRPLIAASLTCDNHNKRLAFYKVLERFIFSYFKYVSYNTSFLCDKVYRFSKHLFKDKNFDLDEATNFFESHLTEECLRKLSCDYFINNRNEKGYYAWSGLRYFLYEYELKLSEGRTPLFNNWEKLFNVNSNEVSIEHIYPQTPVSSEWTSIFKGSTEENLKLCNSLGNLIFVSQSKNSSLQNSPFVDKCEYYKNGCYSEREIANSIDKGWTQESILDRGIKLLNFLEERWGFKLSDEEKYIALGLDFLFSTNSEQK